jgi:large subunit ribosomal protein L11
MGKKVIANLRLHISGGTASPGPPVGPALGQHGLNIMQFCKDFNSKTSELQGLTVPVDIQVFSDRSFKFQVKTPVASDLIKRAAGVEKGSGVPNRDKVGAPQALKRAPVCPTATRWGRSPWTRFGTSPSRRCPICMRPAKKQP